MSTNTTVNWRSRYTGRENQTVLSSYEHAARYAAELRRSGHVILVADQGDDVSPADELIETANEFMKQAEDEVDSRQLDFEEPESGEAFEAVVPGNGGAIVYNSETVDFDTVNEFVTDSGAVVTISDGLDDLNITQLRKINGAEKLGIVGSWELKKPELIQAIRIARSAK